MFIDNLVNSETLQNFKVSVKEIAEKYFSSPGVKCSMLDSELLKYEIEEAGTAYK